MSTERLVLIGAGGHGLVVLDAYRLTHATAAVEVRDDDVTKDGAAFLFAHIEAPIGPLERFRCGCHVAIGDNATRRRLGRMLQAAGSTLVTIVHPRASVAASARISCGTFVAASAVVAPGACVGAGVIVNHQAVIDHECAVGDWCHIAPGAVLGGAVNVGEGCLIGSGAVVLPGVRIGAGAVIAAGAVVTKHVGEGLTVAGAPAKEMNERR